MALMKQTSGKAFSSSRGSEIASVSFLLQYFELRFRSVPCKLVGSIITLLNIVSQFFRILLLCQNQIIPRFLSFYCLRINELRDLLHQDEHVFAVMKYLGYDPFVGLTSFG